MKKSIIIVIIILLCGCSINKKISINNVTSIIYDNVELISNDYDTIISKINNNTFYKLNDDSITGNKLDIKTNEYLYKFEVLDDFIIYTVDKERYFSKIINIKNDVNNIVEKYTDDNFYAVDKVDKYNTIKADYLINLDQNDSFIIISSREDIYSFKINDIDKENSGYVDINLLNTVDKIEKNKIICIQTSNPQDIRISFITPYNYKVSIIYDNDDKKFIKDIKAK